MEEKKNKETIGKPSSLPWRSNIFKLLLDLEIIGNKLALGIEDADGVALS